MKSGLTSSLLGVAILVLSPLAWSAGSPTESDEDRCASISVSAPVPFDGRSLQEIPDIREPKLRLANELLSSDCGRLADSIFESFVKDEPGNVHAAYYVARRLWMSGEIEETRNYLEDLLEKQPAFTSARVLLACLVSTLGDVAKVNPLLDEAERSRPDDVWIYLNRARLVAVAQFQPPETKARLREMATNAAFPPNVRTAAAEAGTFLMVTPAEYEDFMRI